MPPRAVAGAETATTPPDAHNFHHTPLVTRGAYDFHLADDLLGPSGDGDGARAGDGAAAPAPAERTHLP